MDILEKALKAERDVLEEQKRNLREYLIETQERFRIAESRLWMVSGLLGQMRKEVA